MAQFVDMKMFGLAKSLELVRLKGGWKTKRRELNRAMRRAMRPAWNRMRARAPKGKTGNLKKSIATTSWMTFDSINVRTGPRLKGPRKASYAHIVELGSKGGVRTIKKPGSKGFKIGRRFTDKINHPGTTGKGFIQSTYQDSINTVVPRVISAIKKTFRIL